MLLGYRKLTGYSTLAIVLTGVPVLGQLNTECFTTGTVGDCSQFISAFCNTIGTSLVQAADSVGRCFNTGSFKCDLTAWNELPGIGGNTPSVSNCNTALEDVALCDLGGQAIFTGGNFLFTMQPNPGICASNIADEGA
ncbi:hypothetical protein BDP27DRAFT_1452499 [Rhodocollybia butyracea]|uniref:Glycan binding protein Y3-like domain-containing protein n=1 Tax=Rhodocollybia butyracea TaxID=206335 RepID=A0A9P5TZK4_9AGAR|nr:hypothetical protein BDP27DRAFT_1452499 [Rhodocollybia butyracea]